MRLHCTGEIGKFPETIFPWIAEPTKAMAWQKNVKRGEITIREPGMVGTAFTEVLCEDGNELEMHGLVTQFEPNHLIAFHLSSRIHELDVSYTLQRLNDGTRVCVEANVRWKFPMNVIILLTGKRIEKRLAAQVSSEVEELKRVCERE